VLAAATAGLLVVWGVALTGSAAALPSNCLQSGSTVTCTFSSTGSEQTFTVPSGVTAVTVTAVGAPGGNTASPSAGGFGAVVNATVPITALPAGTMTLYVEVGGAGGFDACLVRGAGVGGFNGGGSTTVCSGGGGGASDVRTTSIQTVPDSQLTTSNDSRLVVAGGGGGAGAFANVDNGGTAGDTSVTGAGAGSNGAANGGNGGFDGTQGGSAGMLGGISASAGLLGQGGDGPTGTYGGGGGGGYYGGGGGAIGGGGAGSSFWVTGATNTSMSEDTTGTPSVTISYTTSAASLADTLVSDSTGIGPGTSLGDKAAAIQAAVNAGDTAVACADITNYLGLVKAQTGKHLGATDASILTTDANNLAAALGC
jgi:hypothetical protein